MDPLDFLRKTCETDEKILCNAELVETEMVIHISKHGKLLHGIDDGSAHRTLKINNEKFQLSLLL